MQAGTLKDILEIHRKFDYRNEYGEKTTEYVKIGSVRCCCVPLRGEREIQNNEIWFEYIKEFKVRLHTDIEEDDRIFYKGRWYVVTSLFEDMTKQTISLTTKRINYNLDNNTSDSESNE